eukprot:Gregarina_sp_Poly_1__4870@NODE_2592_length_1939_cov_58_843483_g1644_i0_p3_GENE_NODE_2592_length_1939_cov_58_843483_g1644_i0NODE_2592_length_1939_cov_58_843483_g1644_i0_p3_ORF_typecomplete_len141_score17_43PUB/PF09409_10/0_0023_NODE_2592_length_1939_cov_58_843483_g1644_i01423
MSSEDRPILFRSFLRLLEILIVVPMDASKRSIRKGNANFAARASKYASVSAFLLSLGYVDFGSHFLLPIIYKKRLQVAHSKLASFACQLSDFPTIKKDSKSPMHSPIRSLLSGSQLLWESTAGEWFKTSDAFASLLGRKH